MLDLLISHDLMSDANHVGLEEPFGRNKRAGEPQLLRNPSSFDVSARSGQFKKVWGSSRGDSRILALQALYEADLANHSVEDSVLWLQEGVPLARETVSFAWKLISGVLQHSEEIDTMIQRFAPLWPVQNLPPVERNILRLALYEVNFEEDVPRKAAVNEAVELAKSFGSEQSGKFINGVLGTAMELLESGPLPTQDPIEKRRRMDACNLRSS